MQRSPVTVSAGARPPPPPLPADPVVVPPPPETRPAATGGAMVNLLPVLGSLGSVVVLALGSPGPKGYVASAMFVLSSLGFVGVNVWRQRHQRATDVAGTRDRYLAVLAEVRAQIRVAADRQRHHLLWLHPDPAHLAALAEDGARVWERTPTDADFLHVRVGRAGRPLAVTLDAADPPASARPDPVGAAARDRLLAAHRVQPDLPVTLDLRAHARVEITGDDRDVVRSLARAVVLGAVTLHGPGQVLVAVVAARATLPEWDWVTSLPHTGGGAGDAAVPATRWVATSVRDLVPLLPPELRGRPRFDPQRRRPGPHLLLVVDGGEVDDGEDVVRDDGVLGVTVLDLPARWDDPPGADRVRLALGDVVRVGPGAGCAALEVVRPHQAPVTGVADRVSTVAAAATARRLAPRTVGGSGPVAEDRGAASHDLFGLLGLGDVRHFDPALAWRSRAPHDRLRVPIGVGPDGRAVCLDIKEPAQQGVGPHGLVVGATGSGKSELLRTLVLALAVTHSPAELNLVLVDFKGGATFAGMAAMPHVSALVTNLADDLTLVDRMQDALRGEMVRRQEVLRTAGNSADVTSYEQARAAGRADLDPLPALLVVVDEFSELLAARPEFIDLFVAVGRLGRSLSMHLVLATQRLEEGRLRGLESHLGYRIGLRTFSAAESRTVLGVPDAAELPAVPGAGYLRSDAATLERFTALFVSGPPPEVVGALRETRPQFDLAVTAMRGHGPAAHRVWLPPLDRPDTLDQLLPDLTEHPRCGLVSPRWRSAPGVTVPLGRVDRPLEQRRDLLTVDLGGGAGHLAVVGGPRTGRSTLARTAVAAVALTRSPLEVQFLVLDFGGGTFGPLAELPHVAGVASRGEPEVVRRVVAAVEGIVSDREVFFRRHGIDAVETYRRRRFELLADGGVLDDGWGDVFLVVDGWSTVRAEFDELESRLEHLAGRCLAFGVHLVVTSGRWTDFRRGLGDVLGTRIELRLGDPTDSALDRKAAADVPRGRPGRGLVATGHHVLAGLPRIDADRDPDTLGTGVDDLVARVRRAWKGPIPPRLRLLPERVTLDHLRRQAGDDSRLLLGLDEDALAPVGQDTSLDPHLYAFGDTGSGKSTLLRSVAREVVRRAGPAAAQIVVVDYRRSLLGEIPGEFLAGYLTHHAQATEELAVLARHLRGRLPGPEVTVDQVRHRSWWSGADVYVLVDDYDLVAASAGNPLTVLQPLLAQAGDVGLHLVLTRRAGGASRALFDPVVQTLRDLGAPGILLSGRPEEGHLVGTVKPVPAVPGRGQLVSRARGRQVVQLAWTPPTS